MRYGFIGLGNLGAKLATNLVRAGFELRVFDLDASAVQHLVEAGARPAESAAMVAEGVDALITCLPSPEASAAALLGDGGALSAMKAGATWIEMSTTSIDELRRIAPLAAERGVGVLEAPVTGGVHRATTGEITVLVGGDAEVLERHRPALAVMGGQIFHLGDVGSASIIKVITNMLAFIDLVGLGEALMLAERAGLDLTESYRAICASSGNSVEFQTVAPTVLSGTYDSGFTLELSLKDLGFAQALGRQHGVPLELAGLVERQFVAAREKYGATAWAPYVVKMLEDALGTELRAEGFPTTISAGGTLQDQATRSSPLSTRISGGEG